MNSITVKPKQACRWDPVSLCEVMLPFDPGERRIWTTRSFDVYEGGGEYNVARRHQTIVSYDLNCRDSLWKSFGGREHAQEVNRRLAP